jgi:hypothetical protein
MLPEVKTTWQYTHKFENQFGPYKLLYEALLPGRFI